LAEVRYWHLTDIQTAPAFVRYWNNSGHAERVLAKIKKVKA